MCIQSEIFSDFFGDKLEVFMDNFSIFGDDFDSCLAHLTNILKVWIMNGMVLSWEKFHLIVRERAVLGHLVLSKGLIWRRPRLRSSKTSFSRPHCEIYEASLGTLASTRGSSETLQKSPNRSPPFFTRIRTSSSNKEGHTFEMLKQTLIEAPMMQSPNWDLPFEIMCDASNYVVGTVLG